MYVAYGIPPEELYEETVNQLFPSYLRRDFNSREQLAIIIVNNLTTAFGGKKKSKPKPKPGKGNTKGTPQPRSQSGDQIRRISPAQLKASMKARTVQE